MVEVNRIREQLGPDADAYGDSDSNFDNHLYSQRLAHADRNSDLNTHLDADPISDPVHHSHAEQHADFDRFR